MNDKPLPTSYSHSVGIDAGLYAHKKFVSYYKFSKRKLFFSLANCADPVKKPWMEFWSKYFACSRELRLVFATHVRINEWIFDVYRFDRMHQFAQRKKHIRFGSHASVVGPQKWNRPENKCSVRRGMAWRPQINGTNKQNKSISIE